MIVGYRKSFSEAKEKEYSFNGHELNELMQHCYAEGYEDAEMEAREERKKARKGTKLQDSHRGLGRSLLLGRLGGSIGAYTTKDEVDKDYEAGLSEAEIVRNAGRKGGKRGAAINGTLGAVGGGLYGTALGAGIGKYTGKGMGKGGALGALAGAAMFGGAGALTGYAGGYMGANKNARARLNKQRVKTND